MNTLTGLFDHMVLQRNAQKVSQTTFTGDCTSRGAVRVRVVRGGKPVSGFKDVVIGKARDGKLKGSLNGLPTGGPYQVQLAIVDKAGNALEKLVVKDVLVGDVWVVAGQSNMQGCGITKDGPKSHPLVRAFYMDDHWAVAKDPIHNLDIAIDEFHNGGVRAAEPAPPTRGAGPAIGFAREMHRLTGVPQGLIASAHGGTSMTQWDPELKSQGGKSLYGANLRRCLKNGGRVAGVIWYQGESDAGVDQCKVYTERMKKLVAALRRDLKDSSLPFVLVQIGRVIGQAFPADPWNSIQDQQRRLPKVIKHVSVVPSIDLALDDLIHIAGCEMGRLGGRLALAMNAMIRGPRGGKPPITLKKISVPHNVAGQQVVLEFDNVEGKLTSTGRAVGFALGDPRDTGTIYKTELDGNKVILHTTIAPGGMDGKALHYGLGTDPVCNITDAKDRGLLVMGPLPVQKARAISTFVQTMRVAGPLPGQGKLLETAYPSDTAALPWRKVDFPTTLADMHLEIEKLKPADNLYYFACRVQCPTDMDLAVLLGYDGPVKVWVDGQEKFSDPNGTNPAIPERAKVRFTATAGTHEVVIGLGTNSSKAWGVYVRFERLDVSPTVIAQGPTAYEMPTVTAE